MKSRLLSSAVLAAALATMTAATAHADLKVVSDVTMSGLPKAAGAASAGGAGVPAGLTAGTPLETTTYYKGDKVRTEAAGSVTIVNPSDGRSYTLNPAAKTYYVTSGDDAAESNPILSMMKFDVTADITPTTEHKTLLDRDAKEYDYKGKIDLTINGIDGSMLPSITLSGKRWATESIKDADAANKAVLAMGKGVGAGAMTAGVSGVAKKLAVIKGLPLLDMVTITIVFPEGSPLAGATGAGPGPQKIDIKTEVKSVSEDTLTDDLFSVPAGYKKVDKPDAPAFPGLPSAPAGNGNL